MSRHHSANSRHSDVFDDPVTTNNAILRTALEETMTAAESAFQGDPVVIEAIRALRSTAESGLPMNILCKLRSSMQAQLSAEQQPIAQAIVSRAQVIIAEAIAVLRNPMTPHYPSTIIHHETHLYNGEPWYLASFDYDDVLSGTTGGPHLAYIRMPERIDQDEKDLPQKIFAENRELWGSEPVLTRMHSECLLGDIAVGQARCDCGEQFRNAMDRINERGCGVLFYLRQEGRGVGLKDKLPLLELADGRYDGKWIGKNFNTETAMYARGHSTMEYRDYRFVAKMMRGLGFSNVELISGNPSKIRLLQKSGIQVTPAHKEASGVAVTLENLMEFLVKIKRGYTIPWSSLIELQQHIDRLYRGQRIDDRLFSLLQELLQYMTSRKGENMPPELVKGLTSVRHRLENQSS